MKPLINTTINVLIALDRKAYSMVEKNYHKIKYSYNRDRYFDCWLRIKKELVDFQFRKTEIYKDHELIEFIEINDPVAYAKQQIENMEYWLRTDKEQQEIDNEE